VIATDQHPFWVVDQGHWFNARDLKPGMHLSSTNHRSLIITAVAAYTRHDQHVFNLTIEGLHTFYVSAQGAHILVHNADPCEGVGPARERAVAALTGGKVIGEPGKPGLIIKRPGVGTTDVDVIGPKGELIAVGGPAKAKNVRKLGDKLRILKWAADQRGVRAIAYFEVGTPLSAIEEAMKVLGAKNVIMFTR
jgi:hypothetical protein